MSNGFLMENEVDFLKKFDSVGKDKFYEFILCHSLEKLSEYVLNSKSKNKTIKANNILPHIYLHCFYDKFLTLYRRESDQKYLEIAKTLRKVAHKIYRIMIQQKIIEPDTRFIRSVS